MNLSADVFQRCVRVQQQAGKGLPVANNSRFCFSIQSGGGFQLEAVLNFFDALDALGDFTGHFDL